MGRPKRTLPDPQIPNPSLPSCNPSKRQQSNKAVSKNGSPIPTKPMNNPKISNQGSLPKPSLTFDFAQHPLHSTPRTHTRHTHPEQRSRISGFHGPLDRPQSLKRSSICETRQMQYWAVRLPICFTFAFSSRGGLSVGREDGCTRLGTYLGTVVITVRVLDFLSAINMWRWYIRFRRSDFEML